MSNEKQRREALDYHSKPQPGKIKVVPTKPYATQRDLALSVFPRSGRTLLGNCKK